MTALQHRLHGECVPDMMLSLDHCQTSSSQLQRFTCQCLSSLTLCVASHTAVNRQLWPAGMQRSTCQCMASPAMCKTTPMKSSGNADYAGKDHDDRPGAISKGEFVRIAQATVKERELTAQEMQLLFRVFDSDRGGFLELGEVQAVSEKQNSLNSHMDHKHQQALQRQHT